MFSEQDLPLGGRKCFIYAAPFISLGGKTSCSAIHRNNVSLNKICHLGVTVFNLWSPLYFT